MKRLLSFLLFTALASAQVTATPVCPANTPGCSPASVTAPLIVNPVWKLTSASCSPATIYPGMTATCTIYASVAPPAAITIQMVYPSGATGPASVVMAAGTTSVTITVTDPAPSATLAPAVENDLYFADAGYPFGFITRHFWPAVWLLT